MSCFVPTLHCHLIGLKMNQVNICCAAIGGGYRGEGWGVGGDGGEEEYVRKLLIIKSKQTDNFLF